MGQLATARGNIPNWLRWLALLWLLVWFPVYWHAWGPANFLHLCDVAVILTCIGLSTNNALLLSSQAVSSVVIDTLWALDVAAWLLFRRHFVGGTQLTPARSAAYSFAASGCRSGFRRGLFAFGAYTCSTGRDLVP